MCGYVGKVPLVHAGIGIRTIWIVTQTLIYVAAAAAAKSLQSCPTLCNPIDSSPPGSSRPGILQVRTLEWVAISFCNACMRPRRWQPARPLHRMVVKEDSAVKEMKLHVYSEVLKKGKNCGTHFLPFSPDSFLHKWLWRFYYDSGPLYIANDYGLPWGPSVLCALSPFSVKRQEKTSI